MRRTAVFSSALALLLSAVMPASASAAVIADLEAPRLVNSAGRAGDISLYPPEVVRLVNEERAKNNLPELKMIPKLSLAAAIRAQETSVLWGHTRPNGEDGLYIVEEYGMDWNALGENIGYGYSSPQAVVEGWMNSPPHRASILSSGFQYIGVGVFEKNGTLYWTQVFLGSSQTYSDAVSTNDYGDVNRDGRIDSADASLVLREYAAVSSGNPSTLSTDQRARSEITGDNKIDSSDASLMLRIYSKNSTGG